MTGEVISINFSLAVRDNLTKIRMENLKNLLNVWVCLRLSFLTKLSFINDLGVDVPYYILVYADDFTL